MERDFEYEKNNIGFDELCGEEDGIGIKCMNYELCEAILPKWWFECKGHYLCTNCHRDFGTWGSRSGKGILPIIDDLDCPVCLEVKRSIEQPNCEHTLCIECFKRCYYGDDDAENEPKFPYDAEVEDEYYDDIYQRNPKWDKDYPLIKKYNELWNKWDDEQTKKRLREGYLAQCPLCRK